VSRILVVGGVNMDLHVYDVAASAGQAPLVAGNSRAEPGGKGANVARAAARMGCDVRLVGRVGDDDFGRTCLEVIARDGVDTGGVAVTPGVPTGFVAIELVHGMHRSLLFTPGANDHLAWTEVEPSVAAMEAGDIVVVQAEVPPPVLANLAAFVAERGISLFLDPTPPDRVTSDALRSADIVTPDRAEAAALVGRLDTSGLWPEMAARELLGAGARRVVVKLGPTGAILADSEGIEHVPTIRVEPRDETGAGDVFLAALAALRGDGASWVEAVRFANVASALSVEATGLSLPDRAAVDRAVARFSGGRMRGST
jgi:ribokinase